MDEFLTDTFNHYSTAGGAGKSLVASGQLCTPFDPVSSEVEQDYPTDRTFLLRETFTRYTAVALGDVLEQDSVLYAVRNVKLWQGLDAIDTFYHIILEAQVNG